MEWKLERSSASRASPSPPQPHMVRQGSQAGAMYCMNGVLLVAFVMNAIVTYTYGVHGSFGETAASQLEAFPTLVTPAAWSFSIWAVIFVGEGAFAAVQLCTRRFNFADKEEVRTIAPWFLSVCVCQALWTVAIAQPLSAEGQSTWYVWLSLGLMFALWASLYALMWLQAGIYSDAPRPSWSRWALFHLPFQLHAAWATAALVVNVNVVLVADAARAARGDLALFAAVLSLVALLVAGVNGPPFSIAPPVPPVFTAVLAWACLGVGANLAGAGEAGAANGASEVVRLGLSEVSFCLAAALLLRFAQTARGIYSWQAAWAAEEAEEDLV
mmetsp:Transcript_2102/g.5482  ORF Transcript_2102/g.5482 Transcript_2102/m.5482 type:complete len:328 (+) Transcript_2102:29-1012(+)